jgi:hypothetical protein
VSLAHLLLGAIVLSGYRVQMTDRLYLGGCDVVGVGDVRSEFLRPQ